jgi:hypothetical protein
MASRLLAVVNLAPAHPNLVDSGLSLCPVANLVGPRGCILSTVKPALEVIDSHQFIEHTKHLKHRKTKGVIDTSHRVIPVPAVLCHSLAHLISTLSLDVIECRQHGHFKLLGGDDIGGAEFLQQRKSIRRVAAVVVQR